MRTIISLKKRGEKPFSQASDFGPGTAYDVAKRREFKDSGAPGPFPGPWANTAEIKMVEKFGNDGGNSDDLGAPDEKNLVWDSPSGNPYKSEIGFYLRRSRQI